MLTAKGRPRGGHGVKVLDLVAGGQAEISVETQGGAIPIAAAETVASQELQCIYRKW